MSDSDCTGRDWYPIHHYAVRADGSCPHCGIALAGRYKQFREQFGRRRIPVRLQPAEFEI
jgi:pyruvate formate lyase activating enzyme